MRTTLTIDDGLAESIERLRAREKLSMRAAVDRLLRAGLRTIETKPPAKVYRGKSYALGLQPGIDPMRLNQLVDELDAEEFKP